MSYVPVRLYRNLLTPTVLEWDHDDNGYATVDSIKGDYSQANGTKLTITVGTGGGAETQEVTFGAGTTVEDHIASIEAAFTITPVASKVETPSGNYLRIRHADKVTILATGASEAAKQAAFRALGLFNVTRDRTAMMATPAEEIEVLPTAAILDRQDVWSLAVEIPEGCNRITVDYEIDYRDSVDGAFDARSCLVFLMPHFGNGTDDRPTCLLDAKIPVSTEGDIARTTLAFPTPDAWLGQLRAMKAIAAIAAYELTDSDEDLRMKGSIEWDVPAGKTSFCLGALYGSSESTEPTVTVADPGEIRYPPVLKATVMGGAR